MNPDDWAAGQTVDGVIANVESLLLRNDAWNTLIYMGHDIDIVG